VLVARQPICDADLNVCAYELLHRGDAVDGEQATAQVLLAACGDIGLSALVGARRAYVNVSRRFLLEVDPLPFEPELVVLDWFFCKPEIVTGREIPSASLAAIQAAASLSRPSVTFEEIEEVVSRDPGLSLRLLRLLNSASFSLRRRIETVHEAIVLLGAENVRQWGMLLALGGVKARCHELVPTALVRAQTLSLLAAQRGDDPDRAFAIGLFSVADALLGAPMERALHDLPLAAPIVDALVRHAGDDGVALAAILAHERAEQLASGPGDGPGALAACYLQALAWAQERSTAAGR
jgi:c-di-GMP phosphodiesterase